MLMMALVAVMGVALVWLPRRWGNHGVTALAWGMALFMLGQELLDRVLHHTLMGDPWAEVLPFHLCGASVVLVPVLLLTRNYALFEVLYFWGIGGATAAILTPDTGSHFPNLLYITYFTSHGLIVIGVVFAMVYFGFRPRAASFMKATLGLFVYGVAVVPLNLLLDTNYLYLCRKPADATIIDFMGPWPGYVVWLAAVALAVFSMLYLPWAVQTRYHRHSRHDKYPIV
ncbi:TIGR02206 family membrane protein [Roseovarius pacificus]|uniref:YwaF family protein n=1 Tax=Roseovarius pacificus TaxID=337701 RepID=UPI002A1877F3|nr:TIGR02206 family membrane protein [Roseovarius pacificus]